MLTTLFSLPAHLLLEDVLIEDHVLTLVITSTLREMSCPECRQPCSRIHSRYTRQLSDLPCQGRAVRLLVQVRRFFCDGPACSRKTFAEAFPGVAPKHARRTNRLAESLCSIAYVLGGRAGARLVKRLAMPTSRYTLLRLLHRATTLPLPTPQVLGVDDFAWKKGDRYGTILVDLEAHHVVDLLPDREAETFVTWLKAHPGVKVISRDRAGTYADGARRGAPQAVQVADRFHLLLNLTTALQKFFERQQDSLHRLAAEEQAARLTTATKEAAADSAAPAPATKPLTATEAQRQGRRARRYINATSFPEIVRPGKRSSLDPYKAYLRERWNAGQHNIKQLVAELRERGYRQGQTIVYDYLRSVREQPAWLEAYTATKKAQTGAASSSPLSAHEAAWLFARNPQNLQLTQVVKLDQVRRWNERYETA